MTGGVRDSADPITVLGEGVQWSDGSEERVSSILREAQDRSSGSDELASHISDWPTQYHFSRLRSKILSPLCIDEGTRVLDLGGGTGPLSRKLGEAGAEVLLLDGSEARARAGAARCHDLPNVSVAVGTIFDLDVETEPFDVVLAVGVLEYAPSSPGEAEGLLRKAASLLTPDGVVAIAIENAIGLKYLLGYAEDHVGLPWVSWEGYVGIDHVRTFSRLELVSMLTKVGLREQAMFYPFPDYKLPTVIVSEACYALAEPEVVDAIVPRPCTPDATLPTVVCDPRAAHMTMLRAGLGRDVANSFLVVAGRTGRAVDARADRETLAWLPGDDRRARFMRDRRLVSRSSGLTIVDDSAEGASVVDSWLTQRRLPERPYVTGVPLDRLVLAALAEANAERVRELLAVWLRTLRKAAFVVEAGTASSTDSTSPFGSQPNRLALPADYLDCHPSNFVYHAGVLSRIDHEWVTPGPVDFSLVAIRGFFYLSLAALQIGLSNPFSTSRDLASMTVALAEAAGIDEGAEVVRRLPPLESELQAIVLGVNRKETSQLMDQLLRSTSDDLNANVPGLPVTDLRRQLDDLSVQKRELEARLDQAERELGVARSDLAESRGEVQAMRSTPSRRLAARPRSAGRRKRPHDPRQRD